MELNCRDFERIWNEQLDAGASASPEVEQALEAHGAACPACHSISQRYQMLRQAIRAWGPPPAAPVGFTDRFLDRHAAETRVRSSPRWIVRARPMLWPVAIAASVLIAAFVGGGRRWYQPAGLRPRPRPAAAPVAVAEPPVDPRALAAAFADATSATWDLARETSAPAARIGREVLTSTALPDGPPTPTPTLPVEVDGAADVLQRVGDRFNAGVRPISGTARHAFGFLLGPAADDPKARPPSARGA